MKTLSKICRSSSDRTKRSDTSCRPIYVEYVVLPAERLAWQVILGDGKNAGDVARGIFGPLGAGGTAERQSDIILLEVWKAPPGSMIPVGISTLK